MKAGLKVFLHTAVLILVVLLQIWHLNKSIFDKPINETSDANAYMRMAYNFYHHHVISNSNPGETVVITSYREPAFPVYMACVMWFQPEFKAIDFSVFTKPEGALPLFRRVQIPILILMSLGAGLLSYLITKKISYSYPVIFMVGLGNSFLVTANEIKREHFIASILLFVAIFLFLAVQRKQKKYFVLSGLSLGLLVLSNAIFQYFIFIMIVFLVFLLKRGCFEKKEAMIFAGLFFAAYSIVAGSWMIRNYIHFDRFYITDRAGAVLAVRAEYNKMTAEEYWGAFCFWTPDPYFQEKVSEQLQKGKWVNLHRSNPNGYYRTGKSIKDFNTLAGPQRDKALRKRAAMEIIKHPFKHLAVTLPVAWRGIFVEHGYILNAPISAVIRSVFLVSILYFAALFYWFVQSFRRQNWPVFSITLLCMYLYGMNSFFTHGLARYNQPLIPVLAVLLTAALYSFRTCRNKTGTVQKK